MKLNKIDNPAWQPLKKGYKLQQEHTPSVTLLMVKLNAVLQIDGDKSNSVSAIRD